MSFDASGLLDILVEARVNQVPFDILPDDIRPTDENQGYAVQPLLHHRLSRSGMGNCAGYKIGCTTKVMQEYLNIDQPCAGGIMESTVYQQRAEVSVDSYCRVGVECEIAVRVGRDIPVQTDKRLRPQDVAPCVDLCMTAIEIVDDRYVDFTAMDTPTLIADDFFGAGCVLSEGRRGWREIDLRSVSGRMLINDREVGRGVGAAILDDPYNALCWLAGFLGQNGQSLKAGDIVLLGSVVQTQWVSQGDHVVVDVGGLGTAEIKFQ